MEQADRSWSDRKLERIARRVTEADLRLTTLSHFCEPAKWAEDNISFAYDVSANFDKFDLSLTPYLRDVLNTWNFKSKIVETTVVAPEQTGKSLSWIIGLIYSFNYTPCLSMVVYPSDELGVKINKEKLEPLMKAIPKFAAELEMPRSQKKDCYHFSNLKCYFSGAGSRVTSQSAKIRIADEVDDWIAHEEKITNLADLRKRARSFNESMLFKVCSPTEKNGLIWKEFKKGSEGYWFLRCKGCGQLTIRSADIHNLQWELDEDKNIIESSLTLICPECKYEHKEDDKKEMNINGGYIHTNPSLLKNYPSFQWGALACQWGGLLSWYKIAQAQMEAGKSGNVQDQRFFDNSIRGLPFHVRTTTSASLERLKQHIYPENIPYEDFEGIFYAGDTQDDKLFYIVAGIDSKQNIYILKAKEETLLENIRIEMQTPISGMKIIAGIQDEGGHRPIEIQNFAKTLPNFWTYKGNNRIMKRIEIGTSSRLLVVKEVYFKSETLYYIHNQEKKENNYLYLAKDLPENFYEHLLALRQDNSKKEGDSYEKWENNGREDHYFDCLKMLYALIEFYKAKGQNCWYKGTSEWLQHKKRQIALKPNNRINGFVKGWK